MALNLQIQAVVDSSLRTNCSDTRLPRPWVLNLGFLVGSRERRKKGDKLGRKQREEQRETKNG